MADQTATTSTNDANGLTTNTSTKMNSIEAQGPPAKTDYSTIMTKSVMVSPTEKQYELLRLRLQDRINDSRGETIYDIGASEGKMQY